MSCRALTPISTVVMVRGLGQGEDAAVMLWAADHVEEKEERRVARGGVALRWLGQWEGSQGDSVGYGCEVEMGDWCMPRSGVSTAGKHAVGLAWGNRLGMK